MYTLSKPHLSSLLPIGLALPTLLYATEPPTAPILRIETGMHTAQIKSISVDAAERFLVTASYDKTLRLWELATGKLLTTYRVPMGEGDEGKLYATAIAPDGGWVAGAGWTGFEWDRIASIYLFNRQTGELEQRLPGLEQVIKHLCVSPDGQYLAATLGGGWGLRIWNTQTWQPVFRDDDYGEDSYGCDFDSQNRVATTSWDGAIRLYTPTAGTFNLIAKSEAPGGRQPFSVAFSPNSEQIAVGFNESSVNILDGQTLALLYAPNTSGVDNGNLSSIAWSQDGQGLYAVGGHVNKEMFSTILYWSQPEQGSYVEWPVATGTLMDIHALKGGGVVYGATDPTFGVLDENGNKVLERQGDTAYYRGIYPGSFGISSEGSIVQFGFKPFGEHFARFSVADQQLILNPSPDNSLLAPDITSLNITNWKGNYEPQLNDVLLPLEQYEISRSLAIAPDHSKFLLGTEWYLRCFDATGKLLWKVPVPEVVWGVNISGDGKTGLAALGDGTLRWYHLETGQELLAFFPHKDEKRWIAWTPSGYYMSSGEDAENLIGWHVNNGKDKAAMFYPASALKASRNRPDILKKVLTTLDEAEAIRLANLEKGGEVDPVISVAEGLRKVQDKYQVNLIPSSLGQAIIVAASGEQETNLLFPYTNQFTQEMYRFLRVKGFSDGDIIYLNPYPPVVPSDGYVNAARQDFSMREPTKELEQAIAKASQNLQAGQQFIFYLHGHADPKSLRIGRTEVLSAAQLKTLLAPIPTNVQQIIILDTCYSGSFLTDLAGVPNRILVTSADAETKAWSNEGGSFAESFIDYLRSGSSLWESFKLAKSDLAKDPTTFGNQSPQLDDTQDGIFDERDGQLARTIFLGGQKVHGSLPPEIVTIHPPIQLAPGQQKATLWVTVVPSFEAIQTVHAILTNEHDQATEYQGETTPFTRRELVLKPNYSLQRYEVDYDQFDTANSWKIRYEAQGLEGDWSPVKVGYALAQGAAIPTSVQAVLNHTVYHIGDNFRFDITAQGTETVDVYAGVIFPQGSYYTLAYPTTFSPANTFQPYQTEVALLGESTWRVLNLTLPVIDKGEYQACALLTKPAADPKQQENWLSFHCQVLQVQ